MCEIFVTSVASNLVSKLLEHMFAPIGRQLGYVLCYKKCIKDLKKRVEELETTRRAVQSSVNQAMNDGKLKDIENWLESVKEEIERAENLLKCGVRAQNARFCGWLPNPVARHPIGRKVKKITKTIQELHEKSQKNDFQKVCEENRPIGVILANTPATRSFDSSEDVLESRAKIREDVMKALADDKVSVIGVWGAAGVGKSKLLDDIKQRVKKPFDLVAMAKVSRNQDIKSIQDEIADAIGPHQISEKTTLGRAQRLHERLESSPQKKILIIIDNLREKLELKDVGIPYEDNNKVKGCKLLLSSRNRNILLDHMGCDLLFPLKELEHDEARILFERTVGDKVNDPKYKTLVDGVVKNCGGLPLLIVPLAKRLEHNDLPVWRNASTNRNLSDIKSFVELSYQDLKDDRIRLLFLICALASGRISMRNSLVYSMGMGLFKKSSRTIEKARDMLFEDLQTLRNSSLLLDSDDMEWFRMHDIIVELAFSLHPEIMDMKWSALVGRKDNGFKEWSKNELRSCTAISFSHVGIDGLPEKLDCPNLRMLLLFEYNESLKIPESFFDYTKMLQVLVITGLSFTCLPSSIAFLENLKSLCLDYCDLDDVTVLEKLKGLQFLSLTGSVIARLPKEIGELTELRFLDLTHCWLKVIDPGVLGRLVNLEELYIDSFNQWEDENEASRSNASLAELKNMKKLRTLYIVIPHSTNLSSDLPFGNLNKHKIQIGGIRSWWGRYKESNILKLKLDSVNLLREVWMQRCLQLTHDLHLDGLQDGEDSIHKLCDKGFQELEHLCVENNSSFKYVVDSSQCPAFTKVELLSLKNLNKLEKICHGVLAPESFSKLKIVKMENCGEIKHSFPSSMMQIFLQLEEIEISKCHLVQQIVVETEADEDGEEIHDELNVKQCKLRRLTLQNLPKMTSFCKTMDHEAVFFNQQRVSLSSLESLTLAALPKLKEIWNSQFPSDVSNLKSLKVEDCAFLLIIVPSNLLIKLQNLEAITVERCQSIREVFDLGGLRPSEDVEILSQLTKLSLSDLPRLEHLWNKYPRRALCFRNLSALKVQNCENLRFLFSSSMAKALQQIKEIKIASCKLLEEIMNVQEEESMEAASSGTIKFSLLTSLSLEELPILRRFSCGTYRVHCPTLTRLRVSGCPKMTTFSSFEGKQQSMTTGSSSQQAFGCINSGLSLPVFFNQNISFPSLEELTLVSCGLMKIWHNELSEETFCKLASITIRDCENLSHIFPSTIIEKFRSLKMIEVVNCTSLESLIEHVAINTKKMQKHMVLLEFEKVKLWDLPRFNAFVTSSTEATFSLPSLTNVSLRCCHGLRYLFTNDTSRTLDKLEKLDVYGCNNMQEVVAMEKSEEQKKAVKFTHLHTLKLCFLKSLISFSSGSCAHEFPSLKQLSILECIEFKAFILRPPAPRVETMNEGSTGFDKSPNSLFDKEVFPKLEELRLTGIQSRGIWENKTPDGSICQLKVLQVKQCPNLLNVIPSSMWKGLLQCMESLTVEECPHLRNLFTIPMVKSLVQLQYLFLGGCGEMEYIVAREEEKLEEAADIIVIPKLITLHLQKMIKLKSFHHGKHISKWSSLEEFTVEDCKAVEVILGDANSKRLEGSVPMQQPLLLFEKVEFPSMELMKISHMDNVEKIWLDELTSTAFSKLKKLIVEHCEKLSSIFSSNTILTRFQNLEKLKVTDCGSLEVVFQIQELNMSESHFTGTFQLRKLKLERLQKMKHVWSGAPCESFTFEHLQCLEATKCESLKSLFPVSVAKSMTQLEEILAWDCGVEEIIREEDGVGTIAGDLFFPRLTSLELIELSELRSFYRNSYTLTWPLLKNLIVTHCSKMRFSFAHGFQSCQGTTTRENQLAPFSFEKVIPNLETLSLTGEDVAMLPQHYIFGNLTMLVLGCYHDENIAFPSDFLLHGFPNLEELVVYRSSLEEIFSEDALGHGGATPCGGLTDAEKPLKSLGNLKRLCLMKLHNLRGVWKDGSLMAEILKQIGNLSLSQCPSLSIIFPSSAPFQRLTELCVEECASLIHMGTCSAMTSLALLTQLILRDCGAMEDVVTDYGDGVEEIPFPKLKRLILHHLPSLESFSQATCTFSFPSLERIVITRCPKMNIFCKGALRTPYLDKVLLSEKDDEGRWEGDLNTTIRTLST